MAKKAMRVVVFIYCYGIQIAKYVRETEKTYFIEDIKSIPWQWQIKGKRIPKSNWAIKMDMSKDVLKIIKECDLLYDSFEKARDNLEEQYEAKFNYIFDKIRGLK